MSKNTLESTITLLRQVRSEMHDAVDAHVIKGLDDAIAILEETATAEEEPTKAKAALAKIGEALKYLSSIKALFEDLM